LPQFRHSQSGETEETHGTAGKQAPEAPNGTSSTRPEGDQSARTEPLENKGWTLWDDSRAAVLAALVRALDRAETSEERIAILGELRAWRESR
jgi:hypothetical protein